MKRYIWILLNHVPLPVICFIFDYLLKSTHIFTDHRFKKPTVVRAICDEIGHGMIALCSWLAVTNFKLTTINVVEALTCGAIGMLIDVDHFVHAGSFSLQDALHLETRPPLHNSSLLVLFTPFLLLPYAIREKWCFWIYEACLVSLTAIMTHHLRDANRRGLWLWPYGDTPPLKPAIIYVSFIIGGVVVVKFMRIPVGHFQSKKLDIEESV